MSAAAAAAAAPHAGGGGAGGGTEPDAEGRQYVETQRHAAAVQLHSRGLAIAHLRAQLAMPRGGALALPPRDAAAAPRPKPQPSAAAAHSGAATAAAAAAPQPAIRISVECTPEQLAAAQGTGAPGQPPPPPPQQQQQQQQQQAPAAGSRHVPLKPRPLVRRQPDAAAAARFVADELSLEAAPGDHAAAADGAAMAAAGGDAPVPPSFAPRIAADPALLGQQLAGWSRAAGEGGDEGAGGDAGGVEDEELLGPGLAAGVDEADLMDEEEWI